jgi:hypothetical protein
MKNVEYSIPQCLWSRYLSRLPVLGCTYLRSCPASAPQYPNTSWPALVSRSGSEQVFDNYHDAISNLWVLDVSLD